MMTRRPRPAHEKRMRAQSDLSRIKSRMWYVHRPLDARAQSVARRWRFMSEPGSFRNGTAITARVCAGAHRHGTLSAGLLRTPLRDDQAFTADPSRPRRSCLATNCELFEQLQGGCSTSSSRQARRDELTTSARHLEIRLAGRVALAIAAPDLRCEEEAEASAMVAWAIAANCQLLSRLRAAP